MPPLIDLRGSRFGRWMVVERGSNNGTMTRWQCRCDCGTERLVMAAHLKSGASASCGCAEPAPIKHGASKGGHAQFSLTYRTWRSMRLRVLSPTAKGYSFYGGRGIRICDRWQDFEVFLADMGERPSKNHSIGRRDSNGDYEPGNCRWETRPQQVENLPQNQRGYRHKRKRQPNEVRA